MKKINLVELLKDCPKGMTLNCTNYNGVVQFNRVMDDNSPYPIEINVIYDNECNVHTLTKYGQTVKTPYNKCIIFPKGKTTWEGFQRPFVPGDIVITNHNEHAFIYSGENDNYWEAYCGVYCGTRNICINSKQWSDKKHNLRLATEEEKEKLFQVIKDNGYKWNAETKILEKLVNPIFKAGNKVRNKNNHNIVFTITSLNEDSYICGTKPALWFDDQDKYELVPDKFDINTLKPFDKVLVRDNDKSRWHIAFYERYDNTSTIYPYRILGEMGYKHCIPYEGNEHLTGQVKECDTYYKTWIDKED